MKIIITNAIVVLLSLTAMAQEKKVAIFDPAGSVEESIKEIVREEISSIIVNSGGYTVLERELIDKVLEENKFQSGGLVENSQISEMGKRMGANLVFVSSVIALGSNNYYVSCKMIDVETARIEKQRTGQTQKGLNELISVVQKMVREMFNDASNSSVVTQQTNIGMLVAKGTKVFMNGKKLEKDEVRNKMANTNALNFYNKGISKNKTGNILLYTGICLIAGGLYVVSDAPFAEYYYADHYYIDSKYNYISREKDTAKNDVIAACMFITGAGLSTTGIIMKIGGKKAIRNAVDMYNNGERKTSSMELKFGFTGNGIGLALCF